MCPEPAASWQVLVGLCGRACARLRVLGCQRTSLTAMSLGEPAGWEAATIHGTGAGSVRAVPLLQAGPLLQTDKQAVYC